VTLNSRIVLPNSSQVFKPEPSSTVLHCENNQLLPTSRYGRNYINCQLVT